MNPPRTLVELNCHPASPTAALHRLRVRVARGTDGDLALGFELIGPPAGLRLPVPRDPARVDGLWAHLCCEAFVARVGQSPYREFNFSPSGQWAAYAFSGYRCRVDFAPPQAPAIVVHRGQESVTLTAQIAAANLPPGDAPLQLALATVLEDAAGALSYWALAHPAARPDFHHRDGFTLCLTDSP